MDILQDSDEHMDLFWYERAGGEHSREHSMTGKLTDNASNSVYYGSVLKGSQQMDLKLVNAERIEEIGYPCSCNVNVDVFGQHWFWSFFGQ